MRLRDAVCDERLLAMESKVARLSDKPLFLVYDPTIAANEHGHQKEYADCIVVTVAVEGSSREYEVAHELGHALRGQMEGSLQLDPTQPNFPSRRAAGLLASLLEHPSVIMLVREFGFRPDAIFEVRARNVLSARLNSTDFMSGSNNKYDFGDIATLVEYTGVYASVHSQEFRELYSRVRNDLVQRATAVSEILSTYTSGDCDKLEGAARCAEGLSPFVRPPVIVAGVPPRVKLGSIP